MTNCEGCTWWSELLARSANYGSTEAMCLNEKSARYQHYVQGGCDLHKAGVAVDDPNRRLEVMR